VRDGIVNHCGEEFEQAIKPDFTIRDLNAIETLEFYPCTWEGAVMRMSDKVAYLGRDLEDAVSLQLISLKDLPRKVGAVLGTTNSEIIDTLVSDVIETSKKTGAVGFSDEVYEASLALKSFNYERIYESPQLSRYHAYFDRIINTLFEYLLDIFDTYGADLEGYDEEGNALAPRFGDYYCKMAEYYEKRGTTPKRIIADYVAGMTDDFALECVSEIMVPKRFGIRFGEFL
jgi:dGTPase